MGVQWDVKEQDDKLTSTFFLQGEQISNPRHRMPT